MDVSQTTHSNHITGQVDTILENQATVDVSQIHPNSLYRPDTSCHIHLTDMCQTTHFRLLTDGVVYVLPPYE